MAEDKARQLAQGVQDKVNDEAKVRANSNDMCLLQRNLPVLGVNVPYWVLLLLVLAVLYYCYARGCFNGLFGMGTSRVRIADQSVLASVGSEGMRTPAIVNKFLGHSQW